MDEEHLGEAVIKVHCMDIKPEKPEQGGQGGSTKPQVIAASMERDRNMGAWTDCSSLTPKMEVLPIRAIRQKKQKEMEITGCESPGLGNQSEESVGTTAEEDHYV